MSTTSRRVAVLPAVAALLLAGCGDGTRADTAEPEASPPDTVEPDDAPAASADDGGGESAGPQGAGRADVGGGATELGDVLVDADGLTLHLFTNDSDGQSACYDDCAAAWPPLTVDAEPAAGEGVESGLLGSTERDDGSTQVTYGGSPLYTWASDGEPGDVTGQGVNDVWFVVAPDGEAIMDDDAASGAATDY